MKHLIATTLILCLGSITSPIWGGYRLSHEITHVVQHRHSGPKIETYDIVLSPPYAKIISNHGFTAIYDGTTEIMYLQDDRKKTTMTITKADRTKGRKALSSTQTKRNKAYEDALKHIPAHQRKHVKLPGYQNPYAKSSPLLFRVLAQNEAVGKWRATKYLGTKDGVKTQLVWGVPESKIIDAKSFAAIQKMFNAMADNNPKKNDRLYPYKSAAAKKAQWYSGIPVKIEKYKQGQLQSVYLLKSVSKETFPRKIFKPDPTYSPFNPKEYTFDKSAP